MSFRPEERKELFAHSGGRPGLRHEGKIGATTILNRSSQSHTGSRVIFFLSSCLEYLASCSLCSYILLGYSLWLAPLAPLDVQYLLPCQVHVLCRSSHRSPLPSRPQFSNSCDLLSAATSISLHSGRGNGSMDFWPGSVVWEAERY